MRLGRSLGMRLQYLFKLSSIPCMLQVLVLVYLVSSSEPGAIWSKGGAREGEPVHKLAEIPLPVCTPHTHPPIPTSHQPEIAVL